MEGVLPEEIRLRMDKLGFVTPEEVWVRTKAPDRFWGMIEETMANAPSCFHPRAVGREFDRIRDGRQRFTAWPWRIANFGEWMKIYNVSVQ